MATQARFVRGLLLAGFGCLVFFTAEFGLEWDRLGRPGLEALSWAGSNNAKLVDVLSPMARAYNNVLAMLLATVGLAIPLTANMHTPKLIEMFLRDRTNQVMLGFFAIGAAHVLWGAYLIGPGFAPLLIYRLSVLGAMAGWVALIPYFFYVVRFLDPSNILARLRDDVTGVLRRVAAGALAPEAGQDVAHERLLQIGTIVLKSIDRVDRSVVLEGIWAFKQILDRYGQLKEQMPPGWFVVARKDFVGMSAEAIELVNEERTWFELKVMTQMFLAYQAALARTTDTISSISDATRVIATKAAARGDARALALAVRFFNNFLREAIKRRDTHAIYDVFYQYRVLGRDICDRPDLLRQIGRYFRTYAQMAAAAGLDFVPQIAGFDLGGLVQHAYETKCPTARDLLEEHLALAHATGGRRSPLLVKAKLLLGGFFLERGLEAEAARVRANLADVPAAELAALGRDLVDLDERAFWEVTDRQLNFEWTPPERRPHIAAFVTSVRGG